MILDVLVASRIHDVLNNDSPDMVVKHKTEDDKHDDAHGGADP